MKDRTQSGGFRTGSRREAHWLLVTEATWWHCPFLDCAVFPRLLEGEVGLRG